MVDNNNITPSKPKKELPWLKKYQFKKGIKPKGRDKGSRNKKTALTEEILVEAFLVDPDSGKRMSAKQLRKKLSQKIWKGSDKVLLDVISRKLGPIVTQQTLVVPNIQIIREEPKVIEADQSPIEGTNIEREYSLPLGTDKEDI